MIDKKSTDVTKSQKAGRVISTAHPSPRNKGKEKPTYSRTGVVVPSATISRLLPLLPVIRVDVAGLREE